MSRISLALGPNGNTDPSTVVAEFTGGRLRDGLDAADVTFTIPARSAAAQVLDGLATDVWLYRDGVLFRRCRVLPVTQTWGGDGEDDVSVQAVGYKRLLDFRYIWSGPPTYLATDQGTIAWNLVNHTQGQTGGSLGITLGTVATGILRDRTEYKIGDNIGKLLDDLSGVEDGIFWNISPQKVFTAKLRDNFTTMTMPVVLGTNARTMRRAPGQGFANAVMATGSDLQTVPATAVDAGIAADPRGRWEAISSSGSIIVQATLAQRAAGFLEDRLRPGATWTVELEPDRYFGDSAYSRGDFVSLNVPVSAVDPIGQPAVSVAAQVQEVVVAFDSDGDVKVTMECAEL